MEYEVIGGSNGGEESGAHGITQPLPQHNWPGLGPEMLPPDPHHYPGAHPLMMYHAPPQAWSRGSEGNHQGDDAQNQVRKARACINMCSQCSFQPVWWALLLTLILLFTPAPRTSEIPHRSRGDPTGST